MAFQAPLTLDDELYRQRLEREGKFMDKALDDSVLREGYDMIRGGTKAVTGAEVQDRMNPFLSQVLDRYREDEEESQRRARASRIAGRSGMAGFGSRGALSEMAAQDMEQERLGTGLANLRFKGFENAQSQVNQERARQIQGGQTMGSLDINNRSMFAGAGANMGNMANTMLQQGQTERGLANTLANDELKRDMAQAGALTQIGALQTAQQQDLINASRGFFDQINNYPSQVAQGATSTLGSVPQGTTTTADTGRSPFSQALGLGLAVAGMGIPGGGTLLGAGLSGAFPGTFPRAAANGGALRSYADGGFIDAPAPQRPIQLLNYSRGGPEAAQAQRLRMRDVPTPTPRPQSPGFAGEVIDLESTADGDWAMEDARLPAAAKVKQEMEPVPSIGDILRKKFLTTDEDGNSPLYDIGVALMQGTGERGLVGDLGAALESAEAKAAARKKNRSEAALKKQAADAAVLKAEAAYRATLGPKSEWGKRARDRSILVGKHGEDSPEVRAFDANKKDTIKPGQFERLVSAINDPTTPPEIREMYRRKLEADIAGDGFSVKVGPDGTISIAQGAAGREQDAVKSEVEKQYGPGVALNNEGKPKYVVGSRPYVKAKRHVEGLKMDVSAIKDTVAQIKEIIERNPNAIGNLGSWLKEQVSQDARNVVLLLGRIKAKAAFGNLKAIKESDATLGAITAPELELLINESGALSQLGSKDVLYRAMDGFVRDFERKAGFVFEDFNRLDPNASSGSSAASPPPNTTGSATGSPVVGPKPPM